MKTCQNVKCENIGTQVRCMIDVGGEDQVHEIFLCRFCIKKQEDQQNGV